MDGEVWLGFRKPRCARLRLCCLLRDETAQCGFRCEIWVQIAILRGVIGWNLGFARCSRFKIAVLLDK